jgi:phage protein U
MALGQFLFGLDTLAYEQLQRATDWRHPANSRVGAMPARQYLGQGEDNITLTGLQVPEFRGDRESLDQLRDMADAGKAYALVGGDGAVLGAWVIVRVQGCGKFFIAEGVARHVEFTLELSRVDDARAEPDGGADAGDNSATDDEDFWDWWLR